MISYDGIIYETKNFLALKVEDGFEVYEKGIALNTRVVQIGHKGEIGLKRAIYHCDTKQKELDG